MNDDRDVATDDLSGVVTPQDGAEGIKKRATVFENDSGVFPLMPEADGDAMGLEAGTQVRYTLGVDGINIAVYAEIGKHVSGDRGHERLLSQPNDTTYIFRLPRQLATALDLPRMAHGETEHMLTYETVGGESELTVHYNEVQAIDGRKFRLETSPRIKPYASGTTATRHAGLEVVSDKPLQKIPAENVPDHIGQYRLELPLDYAEAYGLNKGDEIGIRVTMRDSQLGIALVTDPEKTDRFPGVLAPIQKVSSPGRTLYSLSIPKAIVEALGMAPMMHRLIPENGHIIMVPEYRREGDEPRTFDAEVDYEEFIPEVDQETDVPV